VEGSFDLAPHLLQHIVASAESLLIIFGLSMSQILRVERSLVMIRLLTQRLVPAFLPVITAQPFKKNNSL